MSSEVTSPFTVFYDRSGQPLDAGYIYIGTAGINPEVSPISVYWDEALTAAAAQPIRTLAGYPSRDGSPSNIIASQSPYSIVVRDKTGALVYSDFSASNIAYVETIASIAALQALQQSASSQVLVTYNHTPGDGGGIFRYDSTDTTTADNGGTVIVDAAGRRWKRQWDGPVHSDWFYAPHPSNAQTTALQAFLNSGSNLFIDPGTVVSGPVTVPAGTTITGTRDAILKFNTTSAGKHLELLGSNTTLDGFTVDGSYTTETYAGGYTSGHFGIYVGGTSGANINNLTLRNLFVKNYGDTGIWTKFVNYKTVENCEVTRCGYAGMQGLSTITAWIYANNVYNIFPGDGTSPISNCYGITETRSGSDRVPQYIVFEKNRIDNVVPWEGIDVHWGKHCLFHGNVVTNCSQGIVYENSSTSELGDDIAFLDNIVLGWSGATTTRSGQTFAKQGGIIATGGALTYAGTTLSILNNNITGMGDTRPGGAGAIFFRGWDGAICSQNNIRDSYARGISAGAGSGGYVAKLDCSHNTIVNVQQDPTSLVCRGIEFYDVDGSGVDNFVTGLSSGTETLYQTVGSGVLRRFKFIQPKETLLQNVTYYVRADGNNSNIGTDNTSGGAFLTVQGAINHIASNVNTNGKTVTIQIATGTWTTAIVAKSYEGNGSIIIKGNSGTPSNVLIQTTADCFTAVDVLQTSGVDQGPAIGRYTLDGLKFESSAGSAIWAVGDVLVDFQNCHFGACASHHVAAFFGARVAASGNYSITGSAATHLNSVGGTIDIRGRAVTLTGTPAFSTAFASSARVAHIMVSSASFSGSATGVRYSATLNGVIFTNNAGATFLPGNADGTVATGGRYDASATDPENQIISATLAAGSAVSLTTNVTADVTSISLTAGKWRVTGSVAFDPSGTTSITRMIGAINTTSATIPTVDVVAGAVVGISYDAFVPGATGQNHFVGEAILTLAATTTVYLIARSTFTVSTLSAYGKIQAQRLA
jgi:hypothetical protein